MFDPEKPLQDYFPGNICKGCGPSNPKGLQLKTFVDSADPQHTKTVWKPSSDYVAGFHNTVHGALSVFDCPLVFTALWDDHLRGELEFGIVHEPFIWYVTRAILSVDLPNPIPLNSEILVRAHVVYRGKTSRRVRGELFVKDIKLASGEIIAARIPMTPGRIKWLMEPRSEEYKKYLRGKLMDEEALQTACHHELALLK